MVRRGVVAEATEISSNSIKICLVSVDDSGAAQQEADSVGLTDAGFRVVITVTAGTHQDPTVAGSLEAKWHTTPEPPGRVVGLQSGEPQRLPWDPVPAQKAEMGGGEGQGFGRQQAGKSSVV